MERHVNSYVELTLPTVFFDGYGLRIMERIASDAIIDQAYTWLCQRRHNYHPNNDVWHLRWQWPTLKPQLQTALLDGTYRFQPVTRIHGNGRITDLFASQDALVLKAITLVLMETLEPEISPHCYHLRGHGGGKGAVRTVLQHLPAHRFVLKTDVKGYYASIDHHRLLDQLAAWMTDRRVLNVIGQYLKRITEQGGQYWEPPGIALGCPVNPIMGALFLARLDARLAAAGFRVIRFMDDILVLATTRWKLRHAVKLVNQELTALGLMKHPAKTFIGRIDKGFDVLGYHIRPEGLTVARTTVERFVARARRLYERERGRRAAAARLGGYVQRWVRWVQAGLRVRGEGAARPTGGWERWWGEVGRGEAGAKHPAAPGQRQGPVPSDRGRTGLAWDLKYRVDPRPSDLGSKVKC